jgi:hypothetical protein
VDGACINLIVLDCSEELLGIGWYDEWQQIKVSLMARLSHTPTPHTLNIIINHQPSS